MILGTIHRFLLIYTWLACFASVAETSSHLAPLRLRAAGELTSRNAELSCPNSNYTTCGNGLPLNFCCQTGQFCLSLAANTTSVCCRDKANCSNILPIPCNIQDQNVTISPYSPVHTTALNSALPRCGISQDGNVTCCPFGFLCAGGTCFLNTDQGLDSYGSLISGSMNRVNAETSAATPTLSALAAARATATDISMSLSTSREQGSPDVKLIGIAVGCSVSGFLILSLFIFLLWRKRSQSASLYRTQTCPADKIIPLHPVSRQNWDTPSKMQPIRPKPSVLPIHVTSVPTSYPEHPLIAELPATPVSYSVWNRLSASGLSHIPRPGPTAVGYRSSRVLKEQTDQFF